MLALQPIVASAQGLQFQQTGHESGAEVGERDWLTTVAGAAAEMQRFGERGKGLKGDRQGNRTIDRAIVRRPMLSGVNLDDRFRSLRLFLHSDGAGCVCSWRKILYRRQGFGERFRVD